MISIDNVPECFEFCSFPFKLTVEILELNLNIYIRMDTTKECIQFHFVQLLLPAVCSVSNKIWQFVAISVNLYRYKLKKISLFLLYT